MEELDIPEGLKFSYKRVMKRAPSELKEDVDFQRKTLIYLRIGGERLARQRIEITKKQFREGYLFLDRLMPEESQDDDSPDEPVDNP
ncbi:MAG: hypothetical protein R6U50_11045 [Desulfobacterales bacterium]